MISLFDGIRQVDTLTVLIRLLFAFVCGGVIGLERSYKNRPAGFRTHILICVGATVASVTGLYLYLNLHMPTDISRIGAQVVSGLGFIGGGTIIVTKKKTIKGLTTAAGLWASGVIGLAIGAGFYEGAIIATVLVLIAEIYFFRVSTRIKHTPQFTVTLQYHHKPALDQVLRCCKDHRLSISNLQVTGSNDSDTSVYRAVIALRPRQRVDREALLELIREIPGVLMAEIL